MTGSASGERPTTFFIGDVAMDNYYAADRWPGLADKAPMRATSSYVGGMIANAAAVHAGLGGPTEFISLLNQGPLSRCLSDDLGRHGIGTTHMLYAPDVPDPLNMIFLVGNEHVVLYAETGDSPMMLSAAAVEALRSPGYLYTTLSRVKRLRAGTDSGERVLSDLRQHGRKVVFDLDVEGFGIADTGFLQGADVVIMNQVGFEISFGDPDLSSVNAWMHKHRVNTVIRTMAADGVEIFDGTTVDHVHGYVVPVVDVTGAGDTFGGALVFALSDSIDLRSSVEFAVAAASRAVTIEGPRGGVAQLEDIERFQREQRVASS